MKINKTFKFKLRTNSALEQKFAHFAGCCRWAWNQCLADQQAYYAKTGEYLSALSWKRNLSLLKKEHKWLGECHSQPLQERILDLNKAWETFFKKPRGDEGAPRFKRKFAHDTFRFTQRVEIKDQKIKFPKIGWVRFFSSRDIVGVIKTATVRREATGWFVCITTEMNIEPPLRTGSVIGVDVGVKQVATLSDGKVAHFEVPHWIDNKIKLWQRDLARRTKGSSRWRVAKKRIAKLQAKRARIRLDQLHKITTTISKNNAVIYVEDLKLANMTKSAKGTIEKPGKMVKQKAGLNRVILDKSLGNLSNLLTYKQKWSGGQIGKVPPLNTSLTCHECDYCSKKNRRNQAEFACESCGHETNADLNAAKNILRAGQALHKVAFAS